MRSMVDVIALFLLLINSSSIATDQEVFSTLGLDRMTHVMG